MDNTLRVTELIDSLRTFPHIHGRISFQWGTADCREYLEDLIFNVREGKLNRVGKGFPADVSAALIELLTLHDMNFPGHKPTPTIWDTLS